jgi:hypothetical protein
MDDPTYRYFQQNIETVTKEELLKALEAALQSANYWREACPLGISAVQLQSGPAPAAFPVTGDKHREDQL